LALSDERLLEIRRMLMDAMRAFIDGQK
jgi:hypothetical protein